MKRILNSLVAVAAVLLLGGACDGALFHEVEGGPLGESSKGRVGTAGSMGIEPQPSYRPATGSAWHAVDGDMSLCTTSGKPLVLDAITYDMRVGSPSDVRAEVRSLRDESRGPGSHMEIAMLNGTIGHVNWNGGEFPLAGTLNNVHGFVVKEHCTEAETEKEFDELLIQIAAGPSGAWLRSYTIHYHVGHSRYREHIKWGYALMGTRVKALCSERDNPFHEDDRVCPKTGR